jgi:hypothetical protein
MRLWETEREREWERENGNVNERVREREWERESGYVCIRYSRDVLGPYSWEVHSTITDIAEFWMKNIYVNCFWYKLRSGHSLVKSIRLPLNGHNQKWGKWLFLIVFGRNLCTAFLLPNPKNQKQIQEENQNKMCERKCEWTRESESESVREDMNECERIDWREMSVYL